jgi:hydroxyacylglutathione hydrolase
LRTKIMCLDDDVIVYPAHGAGSACGKNLSKETIGTIGGQKKSNYALRTDMTKEEFIKELLDGMSSPPQYFAKNAMLNKMGYNSFDEVLEAGDVALNLNEFEQLAMQKNVLILDVRSPSEYVTSHIPNSIFIGLNGAFAPWVGALIIDLKQPILLIVPEGKSKEAITRLSRVGYDNTLGYLSGGIKKWKTAGKPIETMTSISAKELAKKNKLETLSILDVRKDGEFKSSHIKNVQHFSLDLINKQLHDISPNNTYYIHCAGGYRSVIAASILKANGFKNIVDIAGGFNALKETDMPLTDLICPTIK